MSKITDHDKRIANLTFASVYPHYLDKIKKKDRSEEELFTVINWLTGFDKLTIEELIKNNVTFKTFFQLADVNPNAKYIKGLICGYRIEEIHTTLTRQIRYLDKLVDELARGRKIEEILRTQKGG